MKEFHLAGIIPVHKNDFSFNFQWPDCLMPIASNLTAVERSVIECAFAGCETIWIVCNDDISPIIKHRLGEFVYDPASLRSMEKFPSERRRPIPIFYVPIHPKHRDKIDSFGWSIIYGALSIFKVAVKMSKWLVPTRYYVSFPYSVYDPSILRPHRGDISSKRGFCLSHNGKTIKDGVKLGFTFDKHDFINYRRVVRKEGVGLYKSPKKGEMPREKYPKGQRYTARFFTLQRIFRKTKVEENKIVEVPWYYDIDTWDEYANYIGSEEQQAIERPSEIGRAHV